MSTSVGDPFDLASTPVVDTDEVSDWGGLVRLPTGEWWLERNRLRIEKQTGEPGGLVVQRFDRKVERLGPFATEDEARAYRAAAEGA